MVKAKPTGNKYYNRHYSTIVEYEYRGCRYEVEYSNCFDYGCTAPKIQHENAQWKIDKQLETERDQTGILYVDTVQIAMNMFWDYVEGN